MVIRKLFYLSFLFSKRITGAMGKGLAVLTFDKAYQTKRRKQLNRKPANLQEGLARSGKGLIMVTNKINNIYRDVFFLNYLHY